MSENNRTIEEYIERFAKDYCNGDKAAAEEHAIVKEVEQSLQEE